jgi:hypothetical protein
MEGGGDACDVVFDRATALAELAAVETNLHMLLTVYGQRLERQHGTAAASVADQEMLQADQQAETAAAAAAAAALPELQHHAVTFLASAKALDDQFAAVQGVAGGESAASISQEITQLKEELAEKDALLTKQGDNLVKWQMLFARLAANATSMADDPEA